MKLSALSMRRIPPLFFILFLLLNILSCRQSPSVTEHGIFAPSRLESVIGQDGVCSIRFSEDITLWTFADTITGKWKSEQARLSADKDNAEIDGMISNSIAWSGRITKENFKDIRLNFYKENSRTAQFIKNRPNEDPMKHRFWALDGFRLKNSVYVFYLHIYIPDHTRFLDFKVLYTGIARWDIPGGWKPEDRMDFRRLGPLFPGDGPCFGAAVLERDGSIYLAGHFKKEDSSFPLSFAKVNVENIESRKDYTFLSADGKWSENIEDAGGFLGDVSGECSLSYNDYLKEYLIIYSRIFTGDVAALRFNDFSTLPQAESRTVYRVEKHKEKAMWPYSAKEIFSSDKSIFLIYIDPERYQPLLLELKY